MALYKKILPVVLAMTFLLSSLVLCFVQAALFFTLKKVNLHWYRTVNYYLIYASWSQMVAIAEWWSGSTVSIYADDDTWKHFCREHTIVVMNHKYEIDWAYCWMVTDKFGILGGSKAFAKASLKKLPIIGWAWSFCEMIFLERDWGKDSKTLPDNLDAILDFKNTTCLILLFSEGTRYTEEKHATSVQFAKEKNLPELKYHLLPRTKGFNFCMKHLKGKMNAIYNIQLAFSKDSAKPTVSSLLWGRKVCGHMYVKRIPLDQIPIDDDELCSKWLYDLYIEKDRLHGYFEENDCFPEKKHDPKRRVVPLLNLVCWALVVGSPITYFLLKALLFGNTFWVAVATTVLVCISTGFYLMMRATKATKGSSYGKALSPTKMPVRSSDNPLTMSSIPEESTS